MTHAELEHALDRLLDDIYQKYHYDFRHYSRASMLRRVKLAMDRMAGGSFERLLGRVLADGSEFSQLLDYLTVSYTDMFRDPAYFLRLRKQVVPLLTTYPSLKVWVAGCSTGEEVYSLAILLSEEGLLERTLIYATDIHAESLRRAEAGIYDLERVRKFSENHRLAGGKSSLSDYYHAVQGAMVMDKALRQRTVFSDHSLATDSVFAEMQLVSCRNVLIYFERELQERVVHLFRDSLCRRGFLGLGAKETLRLVDAGDAFEQVCGETRLYRKKG